MQIVELVRYRESDEGTRGFLFFGSLRLHALELPWRDNRSNVSCIPAGQYKMSMTTASRYIGGRRDLYLVHGVPGRAGILFHAGTFAGDKSLGYRTNSWGCPLLGLSVGTLQGQAAVFSSRAAVTKFTNALQRQPAMLIISEV